MDDGSQIEYYFTGRNEYSDSELCLQYLKGVSRGRNARYRAPPAQTRTCGFLASGSSVVLAFATGILSFCLAYKDRMSAFLNHSRPGDIQLLQRDFELPPVETSTLPTSAVEPFEGTADRKGEEAAQGPFVTAYAVVVVVADQLSVQGLDEPTPLQMAIGLDPLFHSSFGSLQFLPRCPFHHPQVSSTISVPV